MEFYTLSYVCLFLSEIMLRIRDYYFPIQDRQLFKLFSVIHIVVLLIYIVMLELMTIYNKGEYNINYVTVIIASILFHRLTTYLRIHG